MAIAALLTWIVTAVLGAIMLRLWVTGGGVRAAGGTSAAGTGAGAGPAGTGTATPTRFVPGLVFGHFLLAAAGLVVWIWYVVSDTDALTWVAFVLLVVVAVLGELMFVRWYRGRGETTVESRFPKPVVYVHGIFAVITVVLVFLSALGLGGS